MFGFFETIIEYYTGRDASQMSDTELALKIAHITRIRNMEQESTLSDKLKTLLHG